MKTTSEAKIRLNPYYQLPSISAVKASQSDKTCHRELRSIDNVKHPVKHEILIRDHISYQHKYVD